MESTRGGHSAAQGRAPSTTEAARPGLWIIDPTAGVRPEGPQVGASLGGTAAWTEVALFSNSKPNASSLLRGLGNRLKDHWGLDGVHLVSKPVSAVAADEVMLDWLAQRFRMVLLGVGD